MTALTLLISGHDFAYEMECVVRIFYPDRKISVATEGDPSVPGTAATEVALGADGRWHLRASLVLEGYEGNRSAALEREATAAERERALGRLLFDLFAEETGKRPPWGILTGVRPARLCRAMAAEGMSREAIRARLCEGYLVRADKADLTLSVAGAEDALLAGAASDGFSLYVSIPFCPSRCLYCSFVSHDIAGAAKTVPAYLALLGREIRAVGELSRRLGMRLQTVYVGGGTPTSLSAAQLDELLAVIEESFDLSGLLEYTVEAGRPDTVTTEKLAVLRTRGADRISINPQTMRDDVLRTIGRNHSAAQTRDAFFAAREAGFGNINMDLIAGLPGDSRDGFLGTVGELLELGPENITVHTLTVKRSSRLRERDDAYSAGWNPAEALTDGYRQLAGGGYRPYYLYRQKGTVGNLENTGFALPGREGLYNVLIMEEVQTILAVGAGAVTKLHHPAKGLRRIYNYKYPFEYVEGFDEILRRKEEIEEFFRGDVCHPARHTQ